MSGVAELLKEYCEAEKAAHALVHLPEQDRLAAEPQIAAAFEHMLDLEEQIVARRPRSVPEVMAMVAFGLHLARTSSGGVLDRNWRIIEAALKGGAGLAQGGTIVIVS